MFEAEGIRYNEFDSKASIIEATKQGKKAKVIQCLLQDHEIAARYADYDQRTALHIAACEGQPIHIDILQLLLQKGANPLAKDRWGHTPISDAKAYGYTEIIALFNAHIANLEPKKSRTFSFFNKRNN